MGPLSKEDVDDKRSKWANVLEDEVPEKNRIRENCWCLHKGRGGSVRLTPTTSSIERHEVVTLVHWSDRGKSHASRRRNLRRVCAISQEIVTEMQSYTNCKHDAHGTLHNAHTRTSNQRHISQATTATSSNDTLVCVAHSQDRTKDHQHSLHFVGSRLVNHGDLHLHTHPPRDVRVKVSWCSHHGACIREIFVHSILNATIERTFGLQLHRRHLSVTLSRTPRNCRSADPAMAENCTTQDHPTYEHSSMIQVSLSLRLMSAILIIVKP